MADLSKIKLNGVEYDLKDAVARAGFENIPTKTSELTNDSGFITSSDLPTLATVATSGSYNDLSDTPTIPTNVSELNNDSNFITIHELRMKLEDDVASEGMLLIPDENGNVTLKNQYFNDTSSYMPLVSDGNSALKYRWILILSGSDINNIHGIIMRVEAMDIPNSMAYLIGQENSIQYRVALPISTNSPVVGVLTTEVLTIPTVPINVSDFTNDAGYITSANLPDTSNFMVKGTDYVTAGQKSGTTLGRRATAEGVNITANGDYSHAEGYFTIASGDYSHAEGHSTAANGYGSHAEGHSTIARRKSQHVFGEYNIADTAGTADTKGTYVEIVGNGTTTNARSNARTLDWSGNEILAGKLTVGAGPTANMDVVTKQYVDTVIGNVNSFNVSVVSTLPAAGDAHTIYFVQQASPSTAHDEYMYINNSWELIGNTQIDLSNYLQTTDIANWAKEATKPTYTAAEVGALPDTYTAPVTSVNGQTGAVTLSIPAAQVQSDWNATSGIAQILNKPSIPEAELDSNVKDMLDSFNLDYTSNTTSFNYANGVSF